MLKIDKKFKQNCDSFLLFKSVGIVKNLVFVFVVLHFHLSWCQRVVIQNMIQRNLNITKCQGLGKICSL